jgi:hypothetical protein
MLAYFRADYEPKPLERAPAPPRERKQTTKVKVKQCWLNKQLVGLPGSPVYLGLDMNGVVGLIADGFGVHVEFKKGDKLLKLMVPLANIAAYELAE